MQFQFLVFLSGIACILCETFYISYTKSVSSCQPASCNGAFVSPFPDLISAFSFLENSSYQNISVVLLEQSVYTMDPRSINLVKNYSFFQKANANISLGIMPDPELKEMPRIITNAKLTINALDNIWITGVIFSGEGQHNESQRSVFEIANKLTQGTRISFFYCKFIDLNINSRRIRSFMYISDNSSFSLVFEHCIYNQSLFEGGFVYSLNFSAKEINLPPELIKTRIIKLNNFTFDGPARNLSFKVVVSYKEFWKINEEYFFIFRGVSVSIENSSFSGFQNLIFGDLQTSVSLLRSLFNNQITLNLSTSSIFTVGNRSSFKIQECIFLNLILADNTKFSDLNSIFIVLENGELFLTKTSILRPIIDTRVLKYLNSIVTLISGNALKCEELKIENTTSKIMSNKSAFILAELNNSIYMISCWIINNILNSTNYLSRNNIIYTNQSNILRVKGSLFVAITILCKSNCFSNSLYYAEKNNTIDSSFNIYSWVYSQYRGAAYYIYTNTLILIDNDSYDNMETTEEGGVMYINVFNIIKVKNSKFAFLKSRKNIALGSIYTNNSLCFENITSRNSSGLVFLFNASNIIMISGSLFENSMLPGTGSALYFLSYNYIFISNITIRNFTNTSEAGGTDFQSDSKIMIINSTYTKNKGKQGGIYFVNRNDIFMRGCIFSKNEGTSYGAAICFKGNSKSAWLQNCEFSWNFNYNSGGGSLYMNYDTVHLVRCNFNQSSSNYYGGAVYLYSYSKLILLNGTYVNCNTTESGGAITLDQYNTIFMFSCTFSFNFANMTGGAVYLKDNTIAFLIKNRFYNNTAGLQGGAIQLYENNSLVLLNSTFRYNSAERLGGDLCFRYSTEFFGSYLTFLYSKIVNQGGIFYLDSDNDVRFEKSIFYESTTSIEGALGYVGMDSFATFDFCKFTYSKSPIFLAVRMMWNSIIINNTFFQCINKESDEDRNSLINFDSGRNSLKLIDLVVESRVSAFSSFVSLKKGGYLMVYKCIFINLETLLSIFYLSGFNSKAHNESKVIIRRCIFSQNRVEEAIVKVWGAELQIEDSIFYETASSFKFVVSTRKSHIIISSSKIILGESEGGLTLMKTPFTLEDSNLDIKTTLISASKHFLNTQSIFSLTNSKVNISDCSFYLIQLLNYNSKGVFSIESNFEPASSLTVTGSLFISNRAVKASIFYIVGRLSMLYFEGNQFLRNQGKGGSIIFFEDYFAEQLFVFNNIFMRKDEAALFSYNANFLDGEQARVTDITKKIKLFNKIKGVESDQLIATGIANFR